MEEVSEMSEQVPVKKAETKPAPKRESCVYLPDVDIYETADRIVLAADVPGADEKSLNITLENDVLEIDAKASAPEANGHHAVRREYTIGDFRRTFTVSREVDRDSINASLKNGVLRVEFAKAEAAKPKKITVDAV